MPRFVSKDGEWVKQDEPKPAGPQLVPAAQDLRVRNLQRKEVAEGKVTVPQPPPPKVSQPAAPGGAPTEGAK